MSAPAIAGPSIEGAPDSPPHVATPGFDEFVTRTCDKYLQGQCQGQGQEAGEVNMAKKKAKKLREEEQQMLLKVTRDKWAVLPNKVKKKFEKAAKARGKDKAGKAKDPNAPKRGKSAYVFFSIEEGAKIRQEHPELSMPDVSKEIGRRWAAATDETKARLKAMAEEDKLRYETESSAYVRPANFKGKAKGGKKARDENSPPHAITAYFFYLKAERSTAKAEHADLKMTELAKLLGQQWREMAEEAKRPYVEQAERDRKRYERDMELYRQGKYVKGRKRELEEEEEGSELTENGDADGKNSQAKRQEMEDAEEDDMEDAEECEGAVAGAGGKYVKAKGQELEDASPDEGAGADAGASGKYVKAKKQKQGNVEGDGSQDQGAGADTGAGGKYVKAKGQELEDASPDEGAGAGGKYVKAKKQKQENVEGDGSRYQGAGAGAGAGAGGKDVKVKKQNIEKDDLSAGAGDNATEKME